MKIRVARKVLNSGRRYRRRTHLGAKKRLLRSGKVRDLAMVVKAGTSTIGELRASIAAAMWGPA